MLTAATVGGDSVYFSRIFNSEGDRCPELRTYPFTGGARRWQRSPRLKDSPGCGEERRTQQRLLPLLQSQGSRAPSPEPASLLPLLPRPSARPSAGGARPARAVGEGAAAAAAEAGRRRGVAVPIGAAGGAEHNVTPREDEDERCRGGRQRSASP